MTKIKALTFIFLAIVLSYSFANTAYADVGPVPVYPQGGNLQADSLSTKVSMDYEKVVLTYSKPNTDKVMGIHVSAIFKMMNNGNETENISVFFPSDTGIFAQGFSSGDSQITNFKVNGKTLTKENLKDIPVTITSGIEQTIPAYQWQETFIPQKENQITIEYDSEIHDETGYNVYYLAYILGTGRGWQGTIKKGDISFVLPEQVPAYAITSKPAQMGENKLPFKVEGNSINISFSNYEPDPNELILLGVYDFDVVNEIEQLKKESSTFANTLKIAGLFRNLTWDAHCVFCTAATTDEAKKYYSLALDKAASKDELNLALGSYTFGLNGSENDYAIKMNNLLAIMSLKCPEADGINCKESIYFSREYFDGTPFSGFFDSTNGKSYEEYATYGKIEVPNGDFLKKYADKMQKYDKLLSVLINNFLKGIPTNSNYSWQEDIIDENQSAEPTVSPKSETPTFTLGENIVSNNTVQKQEPTRKKNIPLIAGAGFLFIVLIGFVLFRKFKK